MYSEHENPVFSPWTPDGGGGPPCLWECEGLLYNHRWLELNVNFLKEVLTVGRVSSVLTHAVAGLRDQLDHNVAKGVQDDFQLCDKVVETRCMELPQFLATNQQSCTDFAWSK